MRIAVIGAGIIGVATAYELATDGHEVTVLERHSGVATEASFAPAGLCGPVCEAPDLAAGLLAGLTSPQALFDLPQWQWLLQRQQAARTAAGRVRQEQRLFLGRYSRERMDALASQLALEFERSNGVLTLWRTERDRADAAASLAALRHVGVKLRELDANACRAIEPGLNPEQALVGGMHLPDEGVGNCRQFAHGLREAAERLGADFRFSTTVRSFESTGKDTEVQLIVEQTAPSTGFAHSRLVRPGSLGPLPVLRERARAAARYLEPVAHERFDAVVIAAGLDTSALMHALGQKLPLRAVYGHSLTATLRMPERGPRSAIIDAKEGGVVCRLGQRVRVAAAAELGGSSKRHQRATVERLYKLLRDWFPGSAQLTRPQLWRGARPALPTGTPLIGPGPRQGVWLNVGHGGQGWALACGSARLLADQIGNRPTAIDPASFQWRRN
jgi:D-amino-acid dehydrogenase